jgi:hypothetical protein
MLFIHRGTAVTVACVNTGPTGASVGLFGLVLMLVSLSLLHAAAVNSPPTSAASFVVRM